MKIKKMIFRNGHLVFTRSPSLPPSLPPSSGPCKCLPGKRENRENLLRERRRGGGDATDGERGGVTAEREERRRRRKVQKQREMSWFLISISAGVSLRAFYFDFCRASKAADSSAELELPYFIIFSYFVNTYLFKRQVIYLISILTLNLD